MRTIIKNTKTGREQRLDSRLADLLVRHGRGRYMTRDMAAQPYQSQLPPVSLQVPMPPVKPPAGDDLDALDAEALHKLAKERGIEVHHRAGAEKVRAALREAAGGV